MGDSIAHSSTTEQESPGSSPGGATPSTAITSGDAGFWFSWPRNTVEAYGKRPVPLGAEEWFRQADLGSRIARTLPATLVCFHLGVASRTAGGTKGRATRPNPTQHSRYDPLVILE